MRAFIVSAALGLGALGFLAAAPAAAQNSISSIPSIPPEKTSPPSVSPGYATSYAFTSAPEPPATYYSPSYYAGYPYYVSTAAGYGPRTYAFFPYTRRPYSTPWYYGQAYLPYNYVHTRPW